MGNHEFCEGCGENDFHRGQTCQEAYPESFAKEEAAKKLRADERERGRVLLGEFKKKLKDEHNIDAVLYDDTLSIYGFELARAEKRTRISTRKKCSNE